MIPACPEARPPPDISEDPRRGSSFSRGHVRFEGLNGHHDGHHGADLRGHDAYGHEAPMMRFHQLNLAHPPTARVGPARRRPKLFAKTAFRK